MAIVQISRITQRKGLAADLPQPLAGAELGWAADQRRLFIGNGTLEDGAPVVGNTEVLTEFSDILSFATQYTYKGDAAGYTVQTGVTSGTPVAQSLQSRLDSYAVITDFGPTGDGVTDVTADINRALFQIFCRSSDPSARRSIFFPAGVYIITDTLRIPPNCQLYGEGPDSTIINFEVNDWTSAIAYDAGVLVYHIPSTQYYRSNFAVPVGTAISSLTPDAQPYWSVEPLPEYLVRTANNNQAVGTNISTGTVLPGNVEISNMKFLTNQLNDGILIEQATRCVFDGVTVQGPLTAATLTSDAADISAIQWNNNGSAISLNIVWNNCKFSGFTYGTNTNQAVQGVTFSNCEFDTLYQGIVLGDPVNDPPQLVNGGPVGVRIVQNIFDNIHSEGIIIDGVSTNATAYNVFYDVGNAFGAAPATSIIVIDAENNISVGDMFSRSTEDSSTYPRINLSGTSSIAMGMNVSGITFYQDSVQNTTIANQLTLGRYQRTVGIRDDIRDDSAQANLVTIDAGILKIPAFKLDYTIVRNNFYRTGTMTVVSGQTGSATGFCYSDDYVDNGNTGVILEAELNSASSLITIFYTAIGAGDGTIQYSINYLA